MRDPLLSTVLGTADLDAANLDPAVDPAVLGGAVPDPAGTEGVPANRAARRGRSGKQPLKGAAHGGPAGGHARSAQGRRINPVRRTG